MKAIRFKVLPTANQVATFNALRADLTQVWNLAHRVAMHNRSIEWFAWAEKTAKKDGTWDLNGCTMTPIVLGKRHAYVGASCEIIRDGGWWVADKNAPLIEYRGKKYTAAKLAKAKPSAIWWVDGVAYERMYKHPLTKWQPPQAGKRPSSIANRSFEYIRVPSTLGGGLEIKQLTQLINATHLQQFGIALPKGSAIYLKGLFAQFAESYKAWLDPKRTAAHKPRFRQPDDIVKSLYSNQMTPSKVYGCTAAPIKFVERLGKGYIDLNGLFGELETYPGELGRAPIGMVPRSFNFTQDASGYYIAIVFATTAECARVLANAQYKRYAGKADPTRKAELKSAVATSDAAVAAESYSPGNGKTLGIDPGIKRQITAHDGIKTFHIKLSVSKQAKLQRLVRQIDRLKGKLSKVKSVNNVRLGLTADHRRSAGAITVEGVLTVLKNEAVMQQRIRRKQLLLGNMRRAYHHRVAVRLFRGGYSTIRYEATQVGNMSRAAAPKLLRNGKYAKNNAAAKSGLNKSLMATAMAAQASKINTRFTAAGRDFAEVPAQNTSQLCHCCGVKGDRVTQELFLCRNDLCALVNVAQNADDNAAKNIFREPVVIKGKVLALDYQDADAEVDSAD